MSRLISDLHPSIRCKCEVFMQLCTSAGLRVLITQTYRTAAEQQALYDQGRTAPGKIVTNAPPGYSWHEFGRAFDICFLTENGKATWAGPWEQVGEIGERLEMEWGGRWKKPDRPHFQDTGGMTLAQARAEAWKPIAG